MKNLFNNVRFSTTSIVAASTLAFAALPSVASTSDNIALGKAVSASSYKDINSAPEKVVDGTYTTWKSTVGENSWIEIDLGSVHTIYGVSLVWASGYGKGYNIQTSTDGSTWKTIYTTTNGDGGIDDVLASGVGRYVRMQGTEAGSPYGYSMSEFEVYGAPYAATASSSSSSVASSASSSATAQKPDNSVTAESANLALGKPVTTSSNNGANLVGEKAVDGSASSRWISKAADDNWIAVDLGSTYQIDSIALQWDAAYGAAYDIQTSADGSSWKTIYSTTSGKGGVEKFAASGVGRYVRMRGISRATTLGYAVKEFEIYGQPYSASSSSSNSGATVVDSTVNLALSKTVTATSENGSNLKAAYAVDGSMNTRWISKPADENAIYVDLGASYEIGTVVLSWDAGFASAYDIQVSDDASSWNTIYSTANGDGSLDTIKAAGVGRYVRMNGVKRGTGIGYALKEFEVYSTGAAASGSGTNGSSSSSSSSTAAKPGSSSSSSSSSSSAANNSSSSADNSGNSSANTGVTVNKVVYLDWFIPTARENGDYLEFNEIGGYEIRYKLVSEDQYKTVTIDDANVERYSLGKLTGTYQFEIATFDKDGIYSEFAPVQPE